MKTISIISGIASILGLFISLFCHEQSLSPLEWIAFIIFCLSCIYLTQDWFKHRPKSYNENDILKRDQYMKRLVSTPEPIFIFTKNMSWADNPEISKKLEEKAKNNELTICIPKDIPQAKALQNHGAKVIIYDYLDYTPMSRFTIVRYSTDTAKLSVGRTINDDEHTIEEYKLGEHTCFSLATDIIEILTKLDKKKDDKKKKPRNNKNNRGKK